jgi:hypothetical protein
MPTRPARASITITAAVTRTIIGIGRAQPDRSTATH